MTLALAAALLLAQDREQAARALVDQALSLEQAGRPAEAEGIMRRAASEYPDTAAGRAAAEWLAWKAAQSEEEADAPSCLAMLTSVAWCGGYGLWCLVFFGVALLAPLGAVLRRRAKEGAFRRAREQDLANPQNAEARHLLARIYADHGRAAKARGLLDEALRIAAESPLYDETPYRFRLLDAQLLERAKFLREAAAAYEAALKLKSDTGYDAAELGLARVAALRKDWLAAREWAKRAITSTSAALEAYFRWAQAARALGEREEAREARRGFDEAVRLMPRWVRQRRFYWRLRFGLLR